MMGELWLDEVIIFDSSFIGSCRRFLGVNDSEI